MAHIVIDGEIADQHLREDGTPWPFSMARGTQTIFADTATDMVGFIIPGYDQIALDGRGDEEALLVRWRTSVVTASDVQALMLIDAQEEGRLDLESLDEDVVNALTSDKTLPVEDFEEWTLDVPLVLIATDYADFNDRPPVSGNVVWIDPSDEVAFLDSLANLGVIAFYHHDDA